MADQLQYDPKDIEALLLNKSFGELLPAEKEFVLSQLESAEEYDSMRSTLLAVSREMKAGTALKPRDETRQRLLQKMKDDKPGGWVVFLNTLSSGHFRWAVPVGIAAMLLIGWIFFFESAQAPVGQLAERVEKKELPENREAEELGDEKQTDGGQELAPVESAAELTEEPVSADESELETEWLEDNSMEDLAETDSESDNKVITKDLAQAEEVNTLSETRITTSEVTASESIISLNHSATSQSMAEVEQYTNLDLNPVNAASHADLFGHLYTAW